MCDVSSFSCAGACLGISWNARRTATMFRRSDTPVARRIWRVLRFIWVLRMRSASDNSPGGCGWFACEGDNEKM